MGDDRAERKPPGGGGQRAQRAGGAGDGTKKRTRRVNAGSAKSLLFLLFHVKLFFEGVRIYYKVVDIFRLVLYTFK